MANPRSIIEINERVAKGDAIVLTAQETCDIVKGGENLTLGTWMKSLLQPGPS